MLYQFMFKNFKSYKNETIFDMRAENINEFKESILIDKNGEKILPVSAIYGPNAGGKSGILEAFVCFISIILKPKLILQYEKEKKLNKNFTLYNECIPYKLDDESFKKPTEFQVYFSTEQCEYKYYLSVINDKIIEEKLDKKGFNSNKPAKIYERKENKIHLGSALKKSEVSINVNENMPYLTFLSITNNIDIIKDIIEWFEDVTAINYATPAFEENIMVCGERTKGIFLQMIKGMGIDICDYRIEEKNDSENHIKIFTKHKMNDKEYELDLVEESEGTKKMFSLIPRIINNLVTGGRLIIDELDAKLHPKLLRYIILLYKDREINKHNAQIIFTSQDLTTMNNQIFRRDEIWFACKNENKESEIYSLYEIRDENGEHIRANAIFNKQYLAGKYGADPYLSKIMKWEV